MALNAVPSTVTVAPSIGVPPWAERTIPVIDPAAGSESGRIGNLNPQSVLKKK